MTPNTDIKTDIKIEKKTIEEEITTFSGEKIKSKAFEFYIEDKYICSYHEDITDFLVYVIQRFLEKHRLSIQEFLEGLNYIRILEEKEPHITLTIDSVSVVEREQITFIDNLTNIEIHGYSKYYDIKLKLKKPILVAIVYHEETSDIISELDDVEEEIYKTLGYRETKEEEHKCSIHFGKTGTVYTNELRKTSIKSSINMDYENFRKIVELLLQKFGDTIEKIEVYYVYKEGYKPKKASLLYSYP